MFFYHRCSKILFNPFCFASPEIIGVKVDYRQTDKFFDTMYRGYADFFSQLNLPPPYLLRLQGDQFFGLFVSFVFCPILPNSFITCQLNLAGSRPGFNTSNKISQFQDFFLKSEKFRKQNFFWKKLSRFFGAASWPEL